MEKVLVTGATGNVGAEVVKTLELTNMQTLSAVLRQEDIKKFSSNKAVVFDFENSNTWEPALKGVDRVFLMRLPAIADVKTYLFPFIDLLLQEGIKHIVFLSLQGVSFNPLTPHHTYSPTIESMSSFPGGWHRIDSRLFQPF